MKSRPPKNSSMRKHRATSSPGSPPNSRHCSASSLALASRRCWCRSCCEVIPKPRPCHAVYRLCQSWAEGTRSWQWVRAQGEQPGGEGTGEAAKGEGPCACGQGGMACCSREAVSWLLWMMMLFLLFTRRRERGLFRRRLCLWPIAGVFLICV